MDKTVEIIVVAMVALVTGLIALYLVNGQADSFGGFLDNQQSGAQCQLIQSQYSSTCSDNTARLSSLEEEANNLESCSLPEPKDCTTNTGNSQNNDDCRRNPSTGELIC